MSWACDVEGPRVYDETWVVARKEHRCCECAAPILPGERYLRWRGLWEGTWDWGNQHALCRDACVWIRDVLEGECIPFGALGEWWGDEGKQWRPGVKRWDGTVSASRAAWRIGARMFAMVRRRERLAREAA